VAAARHRQPVVPGVQARRSLCTAGFGRTCLRGGWLERAGSIRRAGWSTLVLSGARSAVLHDRFRESLELNEIAAEVT
jgi:hypothetical protein